jgi:hydrogenase expression/formation protein HypC
MCLAIPMRIAEIDGVMAVTELHGVTRRASIMLVPQAQVGDYILVHAGCALTVIDEAEAQETLRLFEEIAAYDDVETGE